MGRLVPPIRVRYQNGFHLCRSIRDDEGARAHGSLSGRADFLRVPRHHRDLGRAGGFRPFLVHDEDTVQAAGQNGIRRTGFKCDRVTVDYANLFHAGDIDLHLRIRIGDPVVAEQHIVGVEIIAVAELHALAQLKRPNLAVVGNAPGFGQGWLDLEIGAAAYQTFINIAQKTDGEGYRMCMRVQTIGIRLETPT